MTDSSVIEIFGMILSFVGTVLVVVSLWLTVRHFRLDKSASYIERLNSPDMIDTKAKVNNWLSSHESDEERDKKRLEQVYSDNELRAHVTAFLNLFTELGVAYRYGLVDRKMTFEVWYPAAVNYWFKLEFYIMDMRSKGQEVGHNFEALAKAMIRRHGRKGHPDQAVHHT